MSANFTPDQKDYKSYKSFETFKLFVLENFPFIAEDFDALTYYQMLCKVVRYLKDVIANNEVIQYNQTELLDAFNELQNYVNTYFDNLDVQEEVNNKLDEMAESGELAELISQYLESQAVIGFNTTSALSQATNLANGSIARTLGRNQYNDGYGAFYKIRQRTNSDTPDGYNIIVLTNTENLVAERILSFYENLSLHNENNIEKINNSIVLNDDINILVGDSYLFGVHNEGLVQNWGYYLKQKQGWNDENCIIACEGGAGFSAISIGSQHTDFQGLLTNVENEIQNPEKVKRIIVCGGYNDYTQSYDNITNRINSFINYATETYPNAHIYVGMIGNRDGITSDDVNIRFQIVNNVLLAYKNASINYGKKVHYLSGVENILHNYTYFGDNDKIHPIEAGYRTIGYIISNLLNGMSYSYQSGLIQFNPSLITGVTGNWAVNFIIKNEMLLIYPFSVGFNFAEAISDENFHDLVDLTTASNYRVFKPCLSVNNINTFSNNTKVTYNDNTNGLESYIMRINSGKLQIKFLRPAKPIKSLNAYSLPIDYVPIIDF